VGAYLDDNANAVDAGSVYVFGRELSPDGTTATWSQLAKVIAPDPAAARFGLDVALDAGRFAVGGGGGATRGGRVWVFEGSGSSWTAGPEILAADDDLNGNDFGRELDLKRDVLLVGAAHRFSATATPGAAYFYRFRDGAWNLTQKTSAPVPTADDLYGYGISLSPDATYALIGAPGQHISPPRPLFTPGSAYLYLAP